MELSAVFTQIMNLINNDSQATIVFDQSEAKGIVSITLESDVNQGMGAYVLAATGSGERQFKDAVALIIYHARAITEVL